MPCTKLFLFFSAYHRRVSASIQAGIAMAQRMARDSRRDEVSR